MENVFWTYVIWSKFVHPSLQRFIRIQQFQTTLLLFDPSSNPLPPKRGNLSWCRKYLREKSNIKSVNRSPRMQTAQWSTFCSDVMASEDVPRAWQFKSSAPYLLQTKWMVPLNIWFWSCSAWWSIKTLIGIRVLASCVDWLTALWSCFHGGL